MVSGLVTSPCDQLRIFSGLASWILMASKSAMGPVSSKGLERNIFCVSLVSCVCRCSDCAAVQEILCDDLRCIALPVVLVQLLIQLSCHFEVAARGVYAVTSSGLGALVGCRDGRQWLLLLVGLFDQFDVEAERLQFADKNVERLGYTGLDGSFALDDGFVDLGAAEDVVGLGGEQLLQDVGGAVSFKGPDLHLTEPLSAELRLTAQRLLGDERVRSDGTSVDLVVDE